MTPLPAEALDHDPRAAYEWNRPTAAGGGENVSKMATYKEDFLKVFQRPSRGVCRSRRDWEVFADFCEAAALAISQSVMPSDDASNAIWQSSNTAARRCGFTRSCSRLRSTPSITTARFVG